MLTPLYSGVCLNCVYLQREAGIRKPETQILTSKLSKTAFYISNGIMRFILQTHNLAWVFKNSCLKARKIFFLFFFFSSTQRSLNPFTAFRMIHKLQNVRAGRELRGDRLQPPHFTNEENLINSFVQGPTPNSGGLRTKTQMSWFLGSTDFASSLGKW